MIFLILPCRNLTEKMILLCFLIKIFYSLVSEGLNLKVPVNTPPLLQNPIASYRLAFSPLLHQLRVHLPGPGKNRISQHL